MGEGSARARQQPLDPLEETIARQLAASDPAVCAWVSANAGTGKTHVLTQRVLRLLLAGARPERILCLTYTKAAAAEMSRRVFDTLAGWVATDGSELAARLAQVLGRPPLSDECALARMLFARAIETPGGFKVQTIHAFCERVLKRFPLEAGVSPSFSILDDRMARVLIAQAIDETLIAATRSPASPLGQALTTVTRFAIDDDFDKLVNQAIRQRRLLARLHQRAPLDETDPFDVFAAFLRQIFDVPVGETVASIDHAMAHIVDDATLRSAAAAMAGGKVTDLKRANDALTAVELVGRSRVAALTAFLVKGDGEPRGHGLMTKELAKANQQLADRLAAASSAFSDLSRQAIALDAVTANVALYRLADAASAHYATGKAARARLDFDDLIANTQMLLCERSAAAWVLHKLDGGLDHILVDEAQDTPPAQWSIVEQLADDFFADAGGRTRTIFAVGDEKQSIYSFQGAMPAMFAAAGTRFADATTALDRGWEATALTVSFRSVAPVLGAVDRVFADPVATPGLTKPGDTVRHVVQRLGHGGLVELWPIESKATAAPTEAWAPLDELPIASPVATLAARIADTIRDWLATGERLESQGRPVSAGDILILLRYRQPMAGAIVAALKARGVPVAGADRMALSDQLAVQDLMALGDFIVLPEDDLALAAVLKSPLLGLDEDQLLTLAHERPRSLWRALLAAADANAPDPVVVDAATRLKRWRSQADFQPPFEFYASVLDRDGGRQALLQRLGAQAADSIDVFLDLALAFDRDAPPSLVAFLAFARADDCEIKRDMEPGRDEVRVLTVHGAKGLEAPIVFLPDTCSVNGTVRNGELVTVTATAKPSGFPDPAIWPVKGASKVPSIAAAKADAALALCHEGHRLLYVAMTRARDRLYVAGASSTASPPKGCWYETLDRTLAPMMASARHRDGGEVMRLYAPHTAPIPAADHRRHPSDCSALPPAWLTQKAPVDRRATIPLTPSRIAAALATLPADAVIAAPRVPARPPAAAAATELRFVAGHIAHSLLEYLPGLDPSQRQSAAARFIDSRGGALTPHVRQRIAGQTLALLADPQFTLLFGPGSRGEVPIAAELPDPSGRGPALRVTGRVDRLVDTGEAIIFVDFKTTWPIPAGPDEVSKDHLMQLAAYRLALQTIFPGRTVSAWLVWTQAPIAMPIAATLLDGISSRLWDYGTNKLDGSMTPP